MIKRGSEEGVAKRTLERAKILLRVKSEREDYTVAWRWMWRLPTEENPVLHYFTEKYAALDAESQENEVDPVLCTRERAVSVKG